MKNAEISQQYKKKVDLIGGGFGLDPEALAKKLQGSLDEEENKAEKKKAFRAKMKIHYKDEFNAAAALRAQPVSDDEEDD